MQKILRTLAGGGAALSMIAALGVSPVLVGTGVVSTVPEAATSAALTPSQQLARMSMAQRVGQLFLVAATATGADANTMSDLSNFHVGNVYLSGRSAAGTAATAAVVNRMASTVSGTTTGNVKLLVATDQEGGYVQVLSGPGFSTIPTALSQGGLAPSALQSDARTWGNQLVSAGLNMDLAPVLDTVPSAQFAPSNAPIGYYDREYGYTPATVSSHGVAFANGLRQASIVPTAKHFPGLGRVTLNTDTSANVHDTVTTSTDAYLQPFRDGIAAGVRAVMVSSAYYDRIDPGHIGPFSQTIMKTMLRGNMGFTGVIVSDDLCSAKQLSPWSLGTRAVDFFTAGGTMLLCADPGDIPTMYRSVLALAQTNLGFDSAVNAAVLKVLELKSGALAEAFGPGATPYMTDFNGDGTADVIARDSAGNLWLYPGNGHGGWQATSQIGHGWNNFTTFLSPGDFNGDGTADVIARDSAGNLWLYPGNGHGGWQATSQIGHGWNNFTTILSPGDFNGDGTADVIARDSAGNLWLYPGNGHGGWQATSQIGHGWNNFTTILSPGDFNGDGTADVIARDSAGNLWLYPGNGHGGWQATSQIGHGWNNFTTILSPGDFNGDSTADVIARDSAGNLWLYPGNGHGGWQATSQIGHGWNNFTAVF
ncbi:glycoside hydrolase family 3 N-terminal domain-containing protein [Arthrobacter dokdonensis]|uniref:glycoside hydrolase family 3 N-terminal domain-containing protein n=1 Tax=Arthrobacter dokdonellae TaxID=2211210 RepID=UPI001D1313CB|nr:glycoside hydrolase family 3 N-terminal domain-containing protein [Arthrobacter dokdonellae]